MQSELGCNSAATDASGLLPSGFRRADLVRVLTQCLADLGYSRSAATLEEESGIALLAEPVARFRTSVLEGNWDTVEALLGTFGLASKESINDALCLIARQKYLELLEAGKTDDALRCLRYQLAPLHQQQPRGAPTSATSVSPAPSPAPPLTIAGSAVPLTPSDDTVNSLSSYLMCTNGAELRERAAWTGSKGGSRAKLLQQLSAHIPATDMLPEGRLQTLLHQAVMWQSVRIADDAQGSRCQHLAGRSLLEDASFTRAQMPRECRHVLDRHVDEVWLVVFSHNGNQLATASKDSTVLVWAIPAKESLSVGSSLQPISTLCGHTDSLWGLAWSPDDSQLLTCAQDELLMLWAVGTAECVCTYRQHTESVVACAWLPSGSHFVSAGADKTILLWSINGEVLQTWQGPRVRDLTITLSGDTLVAICSESRIVTCPIDARWGEPPALLVVDEEEMQESAPITSACLSSDSRYLLVNIASEEVHLWDICQRTLLHTYRGHKQGRYVIRSCFGGGDESVVISGSEDSQVYVWHRYTEELLETLPGHSGSVNAVAWCPGRNMLASASDDHTVRIWSN